ncbi:hypothetical protein [Corynebacterium sp. Marseille-Q2516]
MDVQTQVWSPLQDWALWINAWLEGSVSTDALLDAFSPDAATHRYAGAPIIELLGVLRALPGASARSGPGVLLTLAGPGDPAALPAGSPAARQASAAGSLGGAILVAGGGGWTALVVTRSDATLEWNAYELAAPFVPPAPLAPGQADLALAAATREAASAITAAHPQPGASPLPDPRLTVGTLRDHYDSIGLPPGTPTRSARLMARADQVAAIVEAVLERAGEHGFDPHLLALTRHIRAARESAVAYAVATGR